MLTEGPTGRLAGRPHALPAAADGAAVGKGFLVMAKVAQRKEKSPLELTLDGLFKEKKHRSPPWPRMFGWVAVFRPRMSKEGAFYALLAAAVEADGFVSEEERYEFEALCGRIAFFESMSARSFAAMEAVIAPRLSKKKIAGLIEHAAKSLPPRLRLAMFGHVCDLVMADRVMLLSERKFVERLQVLLKISDDDATRMAWAIKTKNAY